MFPPFVLFLFIVAAGAVAAGVSVFTQLSGMKNRLMILEREREKDRELLEAVLLEDTAKLKRLMGTRD